MKQRHITSSPDLIFGKSLSTTQTIVGIKATLLIDNDNYAKIFAITILNPETYIWIGNSLVSISNGFPLSTGQTYTFGMMENTKLYAVAKIDMVVNVLDLGYKMDSTN